MFLQIYVRVSVFSIFYEFVCNKVTVESKCLLEGVSCEEMFVTLCHVHFTHLTLNYFCKICLSVNVEFLIYVVYTVTVA